MSGGGWEAKSQAEVKQHIRAILADLLDEAQDLDAIWVFSVRRRPEINGCDCKVNAAVGLEEVELVSSARKLLKSAVRTSERWLAKALGGKKES